MTLEENREIVRRYSDELWGAGRLELVDQLFAPDFVEHNPDPVPGRPGGRAAEKVSRTMSREFAPRFQISR